jgi:hypothetical protein
LPFDVSALDWTLGSALGVEDHDDGMPQQQLDDDESLDSDLRDIAERLRVERTVGDIADWLYLMTEAPRGVEQLSDVADIVELLVDEARVNSDGLLLAASDLCVYAEFNLSTIAHIDEALVEALLRGGLREAGWPRGRLGSIATTSSAPLTAVGAGQPRVVVEVTGALPL